MLIYHHKNYTPGANRFQLLQEYMMRPYLILFLIFAGMIITLLAEHEPVLLPGIIGIFAIIIVGNILGTSLAKSQYLEIGFQEGYFYMRSAYDIGMRKNLRFYPLSYANATRDGSTIYVNYIDQVVKIRHDDWSQWPELWAMFSQV